MELTDAMIEEIRRGARLVEYGKVTIEIETRGNEQCLDIVTTARHRFQKAMPLTEGAAASRKNTN
jgi:hypothetical protein